MSPKSGSSGACGTVLAGKTVAEAMCAEKWASRACRVEGQEETTVEFRELDVMCVGVVRDVFTFPGAQRYLFTVTVPCAAEVRSCASESASFSLCFSWKPGRWRREC